MSEYRPVCTTVDAYIRRYPVEQQAVLQQLRRIIREAAPEAAEKISWGMPTFYQRGNLVHFAVCKQHIGFYPGDTGVAAFAEELGGRRTGGGGILLPIGRPLPEDLIRRIVRYRVRENLGRL